MASSKLLLAIPNQKNIFIPWRCLNVVCEFLNVFVREFIEEVNDEPARNLIDLDPRFFNFVAILLCNSFGLILMSFVELLRLNDVEAEEIILASDLFTNLISC